MKEQKASSTPKRKYTRRTETTTPASKSKVVSYADYNAVKEDRDFWKDIALKALARLGVVGVVLYSLYSYFN